VVNYKSNLNLFSTTILCLTTHTTLLHFWQLQHITPILITIQVNMDNTITITATLPGTSESHK
jgi:hypothetical protein